MSSNVEMTGAKICPFLSLTVPLQVNARVLGSDQSRNMRPGVLPVPCARATCQLWDGEGCGLMLSVPGNADAAAASSPLEVVKPEGENDPC